MNHIEIKFWGVRGSIAVPGKSTEKFGGNTACVEISAGGELIICDAGTGIRALGKDLIRRYADKPIVATILMSHIHWDHYFGLPFFKPLYERKNTFKICGPRLAGVDFKAMVENAIHPPYFPQAIAEDPSKIEFKTVDIKPFKIGVVDVIPIEVNHPGGSLGWRFDCGGKSIVHVSDNEPQDGEARKKIISWMRGADILIHDAQYSPEEYARHRGWGHSPYTYPLELAVEADVKKVILFHFDPDAGDDELRGRIKKVNSWIKGRRLEISCMLASEGSSVRI